MDIADDKLVDPDTQSINQSMACPVEGQQKISSGMVDFASKNVYGLSTYEDLLALEDEDTSGWTYKPGDIVMEEIPYASVVTMNCVSSLCHYCYQT